MTRTRIAAQIVRATNAAHHAIRNPRHNTPTVLTLHGRDLTPLTNRTTTHPPGTRNKP